MNKHQKCHGGITGYRTTSGTVQPWVLATHIITRCDLQLEEGVLANHHSQTKDIGESQMNFAKCYIGLYLEVLNVQANSFDHRVSPIHISSGTEASHTV